MQVTIFALVMLILPVTPHPTLEPIKSITIHAQWVGMGKPVTEDYTILRHGDRYSSGDQTIEPQAVQRLVRALSAPSSSEETALKALTTQEWLNRNAEAAYANQSPDQSKCQARAKSMFLDAFRNHEVALEALRMHFVGGHTDDFPAVDVTITMSDGRVLKASSRSQHALMLPWTSPAGTTWNVEIPRAVAALMPAKSTQRGRLLDDDVLFNLGTGIDWKIRSQREAMELKCVH